MGEARRRKLAGNTAINTDWHLRKSLQKKALKKLRRMSAEAQFNPYFMGSGLMMGSRK